MRDEWGTQCGGWLEQNSPAEAGLFCRSAGLPDAAAIRRRHRRGLLATEGSGKTGLIHDRAIGAEVIWRMWVGEHLLANALRPRVLTPVLCVADVETLRSCIAVELLVDIQTALLRAIEIRHIGEQQAAVVRGVFAQREFAVYLHIVDCDEVSVFVDQAACAGFELLRVLCRPPVGHVADGVKLLALIIE